MDQQGRQAHLLGRARSRGVGRHVFSHAGQAAGCGAEGAIPANSIPANSKGVPDLHLAC